MIKRFIFPAFIWAAAILLISCRVPEQRIEKELVTVTVVETVVETVEVEKTSPYSYELLRQMAAADNYIGGPASGHRMAFANISSDLPYAYLVQESIISEWISAGGREEDLIIMDNMADSKKAMQNAAAVFGGDAEVFIQFFSDAEVNASVGMQASGSGIYVIGVETPVPGFPVMGVDNYSAGRLAGKWAAGMADPVYGGWENVDRVVYLGAGDKDDKAGLRISGAKAELVEKFGMEADDEVRGSKAMMEEGVFVHGDGGRAISDILENYSDDENIMVFCLNDSVAEGVYRAALEKDRWDPDSWLIISYSLDDRGKDLVREGIIDAGIAFFPERYGDYLVPAALAHIFGNPVPPYIFMENEAITAENIGEYFPE
jgi:ribose transport system substrate-binding protein